MEKICIVAILKGEERFLDEWIVYHRMLGIEHFYLYDDDPLFPLEKFLQPYREFVTVVNWYGMDTAMAGRMNQTKAYNHAVRRHAPPYDWVVFIDADEFIVLRKHETVHDFLEGFAGDCSAISLNWHVFGHNGYYEDPQGLITASLTRRMFKPVKHTKTFNRPQAIADVISPHCCRLKYGQWLDANHQPYSEILYPGRTDTAHINHYQCRSFINWINRANRGYVNAGNDFVPPEQQWRLTEEACLRQFVTTVARDKNEYVDEYMLKYKTEIEQGIKKMRFD
jgi:hypothetical protein